MKVVSAPIPPRHQPEHSTLTPTGHDCAAGLTFAIALGADSRTRAAAPARGYGEKALSPWVSIAEDGTITLMSPATEMGQGSMTSLPLIIAEELDADWQKVRIIPAPPNAAIYGNPAFGGLMMYTAGSNAVTAYFRPLRTFGAQVRRVLLNNAARHWGVPLDELTTEPSVVVHAKSGRRLTYGEIAAFAEIPPAELTQALPKGRRAGPAFRVVLGSGHQHRDAPHAVAPLRARRERPRCGAAASVANWTRRLVKNVSPATCRASAPLRTRVLMLEPS
jgi:Molybdopterin-binding domain of aldehyde dehydrogenase